MKAFGLELRKANTLEGLYQDVDRTLGALQLSSGEVTSAIQRQAVAHALQKMIEPNSYFDVCTIRDCIEVCKVCVSSERMAIYRAAHCLEWNKMTPDYRQALVAMVLDDFRSILNPL